MPQALQALRQYSRTGLGHLPWRGYLIQVPQQAELLQDPDLLLASREAISPVDPKDSPDR